MSSFSQIMPEPKAGGVRLVRRGDGCYLRFLNAFEPRWSREQKFAERFTREEARSLVDWLTSRYPVRVVRLKRRTR